MSEILVSIPDDGWFQSGSDVKPTDKMLCIALDKYGDRMPDIYQYRKADWLHKKSDYFLDVGEKWRLDSIGCGEDWEPGFLTMNLVDRWKPLGLPENENERILAEIDRLFEE